MIYTLFLLGLQNDQSGSASLKILTFLSMGKGLKREIKGVIDNPEIKYQTLFLQQVVLKGGQRKAWLRAQFLAQSSTRRQENVDDTTETTTT